MIFMLGCAAILLGLVAARRLAVPSLLALPAGGLGLLALRGRSMTAAIVVVLAGFIFGLSRGASYLQALQPYRDLALHKVTFTGTANIDAVYGKQTQLTFVVRDVHLLSPRDIRLPGTVKVSGFGLPMVYRGDQLQVSGKLYPTRGANQASVSYAGLKRLGNHSGVMDTVRRKFAAGMQSVLPEPLASFGLGLLVGQRNTLPPEISQTLLMVGLTHIIAVSGYNLTILLEAMKRLLGGRSKRLSTLAAVSLVLGFLAVAGTSASIVRAAVISLLSLAAWYYGRTFRPLLLLLLAAALTAYANPVYVWADISWYLSFLAFAGILLVAPLILGKWYAERQAPLLVQIMVESLCAELMTIPLVLYIFGQFSLMSLVANLLVVALIPLAMLLSFAAGLAGMLAGAVAGWFAWPALVLLTYMLDISGLLAHVPHAFQQNHYLSMADMMAWYGSVAAMLCLLAYRRRRKKQYYITLSVASQEGW